ncbi:unnamed protein product [Absidia cylindrospora]
MMTETAFNSAPIMLQPPTKTSSSIMVTSEQDILSNMFYHSHASSTYHQQDEDDEDDAMMPVPQNLDSEQINYEFPPKSHLKALSYLDQLEEEYSFFDETSFTSLSNDSSSSASSASLLSGYFEDDVDERSSTTTPPPPPPQFFSSLIDGKENDHDLTRIPHHMLMDHHHHQYQQQQQQRQQQQQQQRQNSDQYDHHGILQQNQSPSFQQPNPNSNYLVDDNKLSPLQLPAQAQAHQREQSCDSSTTITKDAIVAPQSFLSMPSVPLYKSNGVDPSSLVHSSSVRVTRSESLLRRLSTDGLNLPIIISETEPILDQDNGDDDVDHNSMISEYLYPQQQIILIKISKHNSSQYTNDNKQQYRCPTSLTYLASDEGYDDHDMDEKLGNSCEIEFASVFLPVEDDDEDNLVLSDPLAASYNNDDMTQAMWTDFLQQQRQWTSRIQHLELQLDEERAMRQAFEKAMEDMTVLMDQQQKVLYDRLEQEQTVAHVRPLEIRLEKESAARTQLEETMVHVLGQLEHLQTQHHQHVNDDTAQRKRMQKKLDQALNDISKAEASGQMAAASSSASATTKINNMTKSSSRPATTASSHRASIMPSSNSITKPSARSNVTSTASGIITNTKSSHSRTTTTTTNKPGTSSIVRTTTSRSRPSKLSNNKRSTTTTTSSPLSVAKSGLESQQQKQASSSSSRRLVFHR